MILGRESDDNRGIQKWSLFISVVFNRMNTTEMSNDHFYRDSAPFGLASRSVVPVPVDRVQFLRESWRRHDIHTHRPPTAVPIRIGREIPERILLAEIAGDALHHGSCLIDVFWKVGAAAAGFRNPNQRFLGFQAALLAKESHRKHADVIAP